MSYSTAGVHPILSASALKDSESRIQKRQTCLAAFVETHPIFAKQRYKKNQSQPQPFHYEMFLLAHLPLPAEQPQSDIEPESVIRFCNGLCLYASRISLPLLMGHSGLCPINSGGLYGGIRRKPSKSIYTTALMTSVFPFSGIYAF